MMAARFMLRAYDALCLALVALVLTALQPGVALAYVDPSVMTYTIQALAGVAVALSAVLGVALRRSRRVIMRLLHIDENANKEVEPPVSRVVSRADRAAVLAAADEGACQAKERLCRGKQPRRLGWGRRFGLALAASAFLVGTVFVVAPLEVVAGSATSLVFSLADAWPIILVAGCVGAVALALVASVVRGRAFDVVLTLIVAVGLCCYMQALFLNQSLPIADGSPLYLEWYKTITVISTAVWIAIIAGLLLVCRWKTGVWRSLTVVISLCLILVQGVGVASLFASEEQRVPSEYVLTKEGLYEVGSESNVIVFVLDTFDTKLMNRLLENDPNLLDDFTGFTYFENSTGSMIPTRYGVPFLLSGRMVDPGGDFDTLWEDWYAGTDFLADIAEAGYSEGIYTDSLGSQAAHATVDEYVGNIHPANEVGSSSLDSWGLIEAAGKIALYRDAPWVLKPLFWFYTDEVNNAAVRADDKETAPYVMNDWAYYEELLDGGLRVSETEEKSFRFIHLIGAHYPFVLDETGHVAPEETSQEQQSVGSLKMVAEYLNQLKALGLYDEATIIVTADHGDWYLVPDEIHEPTSPIMLVKPSEDASQAAQPLKISKVPTGHVDYPATIIDAVGGDSEKYGPTVFEVKDGPRDRYYWMTASNGHTDTYLKEYVVDGDVLDFGNWRLTGREIEFDVSS